MSTATPTQPLAPAVADLLARYNTAAAHYRELAANGDYEGCEYVRDEMTLHARRLAVAGHADLIRVA